MILLSSTIYIVASILLKLSSVSCFIHVVRESDNGKSGIRRLNTLSSDDFKLRTRLHASNWAEKAQSYSTDTAVIITGANGVLGQSFLKLMQHKLPAAEVFPTYRNAGKLNQAGLQQKTDGSRVFPVNVTPLFINILDSSNDLEAIRSVVATKKYGQLVIINNAGVCLEGNSRSILQETLQVNCLFPARLIETFFNGKDAEQTLVVINVSSGDGELSYIHRDIERRISNLETYQEWHEYIKEIQDTFDPLFEYSYSYGRTPLYSLSKALLNALTRIQDKHSSKNCRIFSVCPGNFQSSMSTEEELGSQIPVDDAAAAILQIAFHNNDFQSGLFYRDCSVIPW